MTKELFDELRAKFGTHGAVADALGIPRSTYRDWRLRGFSQRRRGQRAQAENHLTLLLSTSESTPTGATT